MPLATIHSCNVEERHLFCRPTKASSALRRPPAKTGLTGHLVKLLQLSTVHQPEVPWSRVRLFMPRPRAPPPCGCCECRKAGPLPPTAAYSCTRGLVIVVDSMAISSTSALGIRHLDTLAAEGCTSRLVLHRIATVAEQMVLAAGGSSLAEQYYGMRAAAWTDSHATAEVCASVGCQPTVVLDCWLPPADAAQEMCSLMGKSEGRN